MNNIDKLYKTYIWTSTSFQLKSVSVINSQLLWWTNYSVMWCCICDACILFTAFHRLLLVGSLLWIIFFCSNLLSPFSFLQGRSKMRKDLLFWQKFKFLYATPASLSRVVCLRLSKQSSVTARTNFSSQALVSPAQERFSFKVYVFSKECLILVKGKQNNTLNFYCLHKLLFSENTWNRITLIKCCLFSTDGASHFHLQSNAFLWFDFQTHGFTLYSVSRDKCSAS